MANKLREPYAVAWLKWHLWRRYRGRPGYASMWKFRQFVHRVPPGGLMIDGGANVGDAAALFLNKGFTVHAFEPDPRARNRLAARFAAAPGLIIHPEAVGGIARKALFHTTVSSDLGVTVHSSLIGRSEVHDQTNEVDVVDLAQFITALDRPVDVLKLDVEGAEVEIMRRLMETGLDRKIGRIFVETHERFSPEIDAGIAALRAAVSAQGLTNIDLEWL